jgi:hypothetical protein
MALDIRALTVDSTTVPWVPIGDVVGGEAIVALTK